VVIATEKKPADNGSEIIERKVALKFMKNGDQFQREKESREFFKDLDSYVVGIHYAYTQEQHKVYKDALENAYVGDYVSCVTVCLCRNLTEFAVIFKTSRITRF
jgi:hypothetical protein